jgi:hypothetical protein
MDQWLVVQNALGSWDVRASEATERIARRSTRADAEDVARQHASRSGGHVLVLDGTGRTLAQYTASSAEPTATSPADTSPSPGTGPASAAPAAVPTSPTKVLSNFKELIQNLSWLVASAATVVGFIRTHGGPVYFLVQIGLFGIACYIALFVAIPITAGIMWIAERSTHRESTDASTLIIAAIAVLGVGALIRFKGFYSGIGQPGDFDGIGTAFMALIGALILLLPLGILWWRKGSRPANPDSR